MTQLVTVTEYFPKQAWPEQEASHVSEELLSLNIAEGKRETDYNGSVLLMASQIGSI